jgi:site-specific recombinase XerD
MSEEVSPTALVRPEDLSAVEKRQRLIQLVIDSVSSPHSRRAYRSGLEQFFRWWQETANPEPFGRALVQSYRSHLEARGCAPATINRHLAPLRKLAEEASFTGLLLAAVASQVQRVKGAKRLGVRTGNWLAREQAQQLLSLPDRNTLCGKRDAALLSLLLGAGLRREELAQLQIEDIQQREGRWCLIDLEGKGKRIRTVPIPAWTKEAVDAWLQAMPFQSGLVLGKVNKGGRFVGQGMTASAIYGVVLRYEKLLQVKVKPHDLRRTFGKLAHQGGARIEQIQRSYGHATIQTTERYLGVEQDLLDAPCDHLRLAPPK